MVMMDMDFAESMSTFAILTIGDGLVSSIPALLISTATGVIVTRAASEGNLASDLSSQLFRYPKLLYIVAGSIAGLGLFTPIHLLPSMGVAGALAFFGFQMQRNLKKQELEDSRQEEEQEIEEVRSPESVVGLLQIDPIEFEFGYGLIPLADTQQGGDLLDRVIMIRRQCAIEMGIIVPVIRIRDNVQLKANEYVIKIKGDEVARGELLLNNYLAMSPGYEDADDSITGIDTIEPAFGLPAIWIDETVKEQAELAGYTVVDPPSVVATHLTEVIKKHSHELLGRQETRSLVDNIKETHPALVEELVPSVLSLGEVQKVLVKLLKEKVSIKNLVLIFEALADNAMYTKDADVLTEYVRQKLARQITLQYSTGDDHLKVITLGPKLERKIAESVQQNDQGMYVALDPSSNQVFMQNLNDQVQKMVQFGQQPIILSSPAVRMYVRQMLERTMTDLPILSYSELDPSVEIQSVGVVNL
jgi:flagellar biosynthesis protein FlhA